MKTIDGAASAASWKRHLTSFSPSPTHLLVRLAAEMLKNVARASLASALASSVLPLPGGPDSKMRCRASYP